MKILISHPTGNSNLRAVIDALFRHEMLHKFHTSMAVNKNAAWLEVLPQGLSNELKRRSFAIPSGFIDTHPLMEIGRLASKKMKMPYLTRHEKGIFSVDSMYQIFDKQVAKSLKSLPFQVDLKAVYAYEDGALETFKRAKKLGLKCIYDLPIAYWETGRSLLQEEAVRYPEWVPTLGGGILDSQKKLDRKTQEMELADVVVAPGSFVLNSIPEKAKSKKLIMSPFGSPSSDIAITERKKVNDRPLRVLFVGSMGQRKGLGDLFEAVKLLERSVELIVLGTPLMPLESYFKIYPDFKHEHSRPHTEVLELMRSCDVFCLPSIVEGRALVMQEAMSQGLPIIITPNTGGEDLVKEGETGFLVPIRSPEKIAEKLNWFIENREQICSMGRRAATHAAKLSWVNYGNTIVNSLHEYLGESN